MMVIFSCATITLACAIEMMTNETAGKQTRNRKVWMKNWLRERDTKGAYVNILNELRLNDLEHFRKYLRMNTETFQVG